MNNSGQVGVVGVFLPKAVSNPSTERHSAERRDNDANAGSDRFSDIFESAGYRDKNGRPKKTEADGAPRRGEVIDTGLSARTAETPATGDQDTSIDGLVGFNLQYLDNAKRGDYYPSGIRGLISQSEVYQFSNLIDERFKVAFVTAAEKRTSDQQFATASLETIKLSASLSERFNSALITSKLSETARTGDPAHNIDARRDGAISFSLRPDATPGVIGRSVSAFGVLSQFERTHAEFSPGAERIAESRPATSEAGIFNVRSQQNTQTLQAALNSQDAYGFLGASLTAGAGGLAGTIDSDILFDPALSTQGVAARIVGGSSFVASSTAHSFAGYSGVLPQIQAAVIAHNGRDTIEVRLDPPDLGRVRIDFNVEGGDAIKAVVGADRAETLDYLRRNIADLEQQLKQAGFGSISFEFQSRGEQQVADDRDSADSTAQSDDYNDAAGSRNKVYLSLRENAQLDLLL